jgi:organic hydroperoxide reductase OsmC/OhrA
MKMSEHRAVVKWRRESDDFDYESYNRDHKWVFNRETEVRASAAPEYLGSPGLVDPEQALVAALSSCHMLTFLAIAAKKRFVVDEYKDNAVGYLGKNAEGRLAITRVILKPKVTFALSATQTGEDLAELHDSAHRHCFIANSVTTEVTVEG